MSSTKRGAERSRDDWYPTPHWCVHRLLETLPLNVRFGTSTHWLEPCAGDGDIIAAERSFRSKDPNSQRNEFYAPGNGTGWTAVEIRDECKRPLSELKPSLLNVRIMDFLDYAKAVKKSIDEDGEHRFDGVMTNPPFCLAMPILEACLPIARVTIMLLRMNFLGSEERAPFFQKYMPTLYTLPNRPSFVGKGTDSIEYAWFMWEGFHIRKQGTIQLLDSTPLDERKNDPVRKRLLQSPLGKRPDFEVTP